MTFEAIAEGPGKARGEVGQSRPAVLQTCQCGTPGGCGLSRGWCAGRGEPRPALGAGVRLEAGLGCGHGPGTLARELCAPHSRTVKVIHSVGSLGYRALVPAVRSSGLGTSSGPCAGCAQSCHLAMSRRGLPSCRGGPGICAREPDRRHRSVRRASTVRSSWRPASSSSKLSEGKPCHPMR